MIRIGIIGTGKIVQRFIKQSLTNKKVKITCIYSRSLDKAETWAKKYNIAHSTDDLNKMIEHIDAIYIASPNGLHYKQSKLFLNNNIHVLVEKTITFTVEEVKDLISLARSKKLILLEAYVTVHLPIFSKLKKLVHEINPEVVNLNFNRISSRMPSVEKGIYDSVFDKDFGKGATYDSLVYPLQLVLYLLGKVKTVKAMAIKLPNGVNLSNHVILKHENGTITTITCSKGVTSYAQSEFIGHNSSLVLSQVHPLSGIKVYTKNGIKEIADNTNEESLMTYELNDFVKMIKNKDYLSRDYWLNHSLMNLEVIEAIIKSENELGVEVYEK
ncbi:MAG: Gfo/Idh/MocA family oxidoreductase [Spiroplasma sp. WSS]|nr:MAG: Gfo/Idh/MocA family oxidoreductase [Spiroplasma sp. WSS]